MGIFFLHTKMPATNSYFHSRVVLTWGSAFCRFDCGMFMLKYIDFYSRGFDLCFTQVKIAENYTENYHSLFFGGLK